MFLATFFAISEPLFGWFCLHNTGAHLRRRESILGGVHCAAAGVEPLQLTPSCVHPSPRLTPSGYTAVIVKCVKCSVQNVWNAVCKMWTITVWNVNPRVKCGMRNVRHSPSTPYGSTSVKLSDTCELWFAKCALNSCPSLCCANGNNIWLCATFVFSQTVSPVHFNGMHCSAALWCSLHSSLWQFKGCKVKFGQLATRNSWSCGNNIIVVSRSNQIKLATSWEDAKWSLSSWPLETTDAADPAVTTPTLLLMTVDQICTGQKWHL